MRSFHLFASKKITFSSKVCSSFFGNVCASSSVSCDAITDVECYFSGASDSPEWRCFFKATPKRKSNVKELLEQVEQESQEQSKETLSCFISPWHHLPLSYQSIELSTSFSTQTNKNIENEGNECLPSVFEPAMLFQQVYKTSSERSYSSADTVSCGASSVSSSSSLSSQSSSSSSDKSVNSVDYHKMIEKVKAFTYVNEIPLNSRAKLEMMKSEAFNPIAQDTFKKLPGKPLRYFRYGNAPFNYGFMPQTWEDPESAHCEQSNSITLKGDGDPLDVVLLGPKLMTGAITAIKILGVLGLVDEGELDWKIIAEPVSESNLVHSFDENGVKTDNTSEFVIPERSTIYKNLAKESKTTYSVKESTHVNIKAEHDEANIPSEVKSVIIDWFQNYKTADGKPKNEFLYNARIRGVEAALEVIASTSEQYKELITSKLS